MRRFLLATAVLLLGTTAAHGDGGKILLHQDAGPFTVTLFAAPQPLSVGMADVSVMVQDRTSGDVLLEPMIDVTLSQAAELSPPVRLAAGQASNRLLQAAAVHFPRAGQWKLGITVRRGSDVAQLSTECMVEDDHSRAALVWFYCLLPVVVIVIFAIHQWLRMRHSTWLGTAKKPHA